jgi:hypothetical protein
MDGTTFVLVAEAHAVDQVGRVVKLPRGTFIRGQQLGRAGTTFVASQSGQIWTAMKSNDALVMTQRIVNLR